MTDMDAVAQATAAMSLGTAVGRPFPVLTNAFKVTPPDLVCYHYDVKIKPDTPPTPPRLNRLIWQHLANDMKVFGDTAVCFDGRSMAYSPRKLPADEGQWNVLIPEEEGSGGRRSTRDFTVTIKFTRAIDIARLGVFVRGDLRGKDNVPDPSEVQSAIQALNVLIQHGSSQIYPSRAASFFLPPANPLQASISRGLEIWRGFYTSLRMGPSVLFLNLDIASQPMIKSGNLPDVVLDFLRGDRRQLQLADLDAQSMPAQAYIRLSRFLRGLKIKLRCRDENGYQPTRKIKSIEAQAANSKRPEHMFEANGVSHTVETYFQSVYNVQLQHPGWPVVSVSATARWPIELCDVEAGQKYTKKLEPDQTADAIRLTTVGPRDRVQMLNVGLERIAPVPEALAQWGIDIDRKPIEVQARELPQPTIGYQNRSLTPQNGVWDVRGMTLKNPARIERWLVVVFDQPNFFTIGDAQSAVLGLVGACTSMGMHIANQRPAIEYAPRGADVGSFLLRLGATMMQEQGNPPDLIICFLPRKPCDAYGEIKRFGDQKVGVATQCLFENKAKKGNRQYYENIALKINHKLQGGINSILSPTDLGPITERPTMLIGIDVSQAAPKSLAPFVAAAVGSMDEHATVYGTAITVQHSRLEIVAHLEKMVLKLIRQFCRKHNMPPERIIFGQVIATEVVACREAAKKFGAEHCRQYEPELTFLTCGKRHHISLFPRDRADADPKTGNVKSGTVIDTSVCSPFMFDWYCQSHASLLGTGRSSHYTVLCDDAGFTSDQLQTMVFALCFTYARATRAVSVVTPAFYASRLCTRAQLLLKRDDDDSTTVISTASGSSDERLKQQALSEYTSRLKDIHPNHEETLFWM
ncbi:hypothetical protein JCM8097_001182 [Rhodosporidiobolus ruineniae]